MNRAITLEPLEKQPNPDVMSERNYYVYCNAWCAVMEPEIDSFWCYPEYQYAGNNGIVFG